MMCDASRLTTLVLSYVHPIAPEPRLVYSAVSHAGSLFAIALLDGVLQQSRPQLFSGFHMAMALAAVACVTRQREKAHQDPNHIILQSIERNEGPRGNDGQEHHQRDNAFA
jgi:hypothetical protein